MTESSPILKVVKSGLCTGCGTCAGICPQQALTMHISDDGIFLPSLSEDDCNGCGLCFKCCPGNILDFERMTSIAFSEPCFDTLIGHYQECYSVFSHNTELLLNSSTGGTVTSLLIFALEHNLIDGVIVTRMSKTNPLITEPFIARTKEEIISSAKSKYCPVALNETLRYIFKEKGHFAVVGLPCHIHGIRKAEQTFPVLKEKIVLHLGLMCSHTASFSGTSFLTEKFGVNPKLIKSLDYRGGGWPGRMKIELKDGSIILVPFSRDWNAYWTVFACFLFVPFRCLMCPDHFNELADISVGDAWLREFRHNKSATSVVITRSKAVDTMLRAFLSNNISFSAKILSTNKIKESQDFSLNIKKENLKSRLAQFRRLGKATPKITPLYNSSSNYLGVSTFLIYLSYIVSSKKTFKNLLLHVPLPIIRLYFGCFRCAFYLSHKRDNF